MNVQRIVRRVRVLMRRWERKAKFKELRSTLQALKNIEDWNRSMTENSQTPGRTIVYGNLTVARRASLQMRSDELIQELGVCNKQKRLMA